jgi:hypothetical protein
MEGDTFYHAEVDTVHFFICMLYIIAGSLLIEYFPDTGSGSSIADVGNCHGTGFADGANGARRNGTLPGELVAWT